MLEEIVQGGSRVPQASTGKKACGGPKEVGKDLNQRAGARSARKSKSPYDLRSVRIGCRTNVSGKIIQGRFQQKTPAVSGVVRWEERVGGGSTSMAVPLAWGEG